MTSAFAAPSPTSVPARLAIGEPVPDIDLRGSDGRRHRLKDHRGRIVVLEWTSPVCEVSAIKYRQEQVQHVQQAALARGVVWFILNSSAPGARSHLTARDARSWIVAQRAHVTALLLDEHAQVAWRYGVKVTPSFLVIDKRGHLAYRGALDRDWRDGRPGQDDHVSAALADLLANRPVSTSETQTGGCPIRYPASGPPSG